MRPLDTLSRVYIPALRGSLPGLHLHNTTLSRCGAMLPLGALCVRVQCTSVVSCILHRDVGLHLVRCLVCVARYPNMRFRRGDVHNVQITVSRRISGYGPRGSAGMRATASLDVDSAPIWAHISSRCGSAAYLGLLWIFDKLLICGFRENRDFHVLHAFALFCWSPSRAAVSLSFAHVRRAQVASQGIIFIK